MGAPACEQHFMKIFAEHRQKIFSQCRLNIDEYCQHLPNIDLILGSELFDNGRKYSFSVV